MLKNLPGHSSCWRKIHSICGQRVVAVDVRICENWVPNSESSNHCPRFIALASIYKYAMIWDMRILNRQRHFLDVVHVNTAIWLCYQNIFHIDKDSNHCCFPSTIWRIWPTQSVPCSDMHKTILYLYIIAVGTISTAKDGANCNILSKISVGDQNSRYSWKAIGLYCSKWISRRWRHSYLNACRTQKHWPIHRNRPVAGQLTVLGICSK